MNVQTTDRNESPVTVDIFAGQVVANADGTEIEIFCIIPDGNGLHTVMGSVIAARRIIGHNESVSLPIAHLAVSLARGDMWAIERCPGCSSRNFRRVDLSGGRYVNNCDACGALWSRSIDRETAALLVLPMGTSRTYPATDTREYLFDFCDEGRSFRRHGFAVAGICVQAG